MTESMGIRRRRGSGSIGPQGMLVSKNGKQRLQHVVIAEDVLGKGLPKKAVVHHIDGNNLNNNKNNLMICENQAYHMLIHLRQRAYDECGNADWRKCPFCKSYDDPKKMQKNGKSYRHRGCVREYNRRLKLSKR